MMSGVKKTPNMSQIIYLWANDRHLSQKQSSLAHGNRMGKICAGKPRISSQLSATFAGGAGLAAGPQCHQPCSGNLSWLTKVLSN